MKIKYNKYFGLIVPNKTNYEKSRGKKGKGVVFTENSQVEKKSKLPRA